MHESQSCIQSNRSIYYHHTLQEIVAENDGLGAQGIPLVLVPVVHALGVGCTHDDQLVNEAAAVGVGYQPGDDPAPIMCN